MTALRAATPRDAELIASQRERMFRENGFAEDALTPMTAAFTGWVRAALARGTYLGWLAEEDGRVTGGAGLMLPDWPPHPLDAAPARAYVLNVFVEPGDRGRGLARTLMDHLLAEARARDVRVVALHASGLGRPLYERMGFTPTNEMRLVLEPA